MSDPLVLRRARGPVLVATGFLGALGAIFTGLMLWITSHGVPVFDDLLIALLFLLCGPGLLIFAALAINMLRDPGRALLVVDDGGVTLAEARPFWRLGPERRLTWGEIARIRYVSGGYGAKSMDFLSRAGARYRVPAGGHSLSLSSVLKDIEARFAKAGIAHERRFVYYLIADRTQLILTETP
jgi:hypothetical protein